MAVTQLEIVNKALANIGIAPIASMAESSPACELANLIWDSCRKEALRGDWSFATVIVTLSTANYTIVASDWTYAYQYPADCLAMQRVYYSVKDKKQLFREVFDPVNQAKVILSNIQSAIGEYSYDMTDPQFYDANFVNVLAYLLSANMAKPLTGDVQLAEAMFKLYSGLMSEAERKSSYESDKSESSNQSSAFVDARDGSSLASEDHYTIPQRQA